MGMVMEADQSFGGLVEHLCDALQSVEVLYKLISDFYGQCQKYREMEDTFADDLQVLLGKLLCGNHLFLLRATTNSGPSTCTSFWTYIMWPWHAVHDIPPQRRNIYQVLGTTRNHIWRMHKTEKVLSCFQKHQCRNKLDKDSWKKLSKNSRQQKNKINKQEPHISSL